jgi:hypothetical protein
VVLGLVFAVVENRTVATATTTTTSSTTTTVPSSKPQPGWVVASSSARGVMVDYTNENVDGSVFRILRLRARTTLLRWHDGSEDPPSSAGEVPTDAGPSIDWASEGLAGVVAVFNGGFKESADAGGAVADGVTLEPLVRGDMTLALSNEGHWSMGVWGSKGFPAPGFDAIAYRQNLGPLVLHGALTPAATSTDWTYWGSTWPDSAGAFTSRSGIGVDRNGNLVYVAAIGHVDVAQLGIALLRAGAVSAMELDINPFWPIMGASRAPLHAPGALPVQVPYAEHDPTIYETGWERDFFVALAEPGSWECAWTSPGLRPGVTGAQAQRLSIEGSACRSLARKGSNPTTTTSSAVASQRVVYEPVS